MLRVEANLVVLSATVVDRHHALVSGLGQEDFRVYENHVLQQITLFKHEDIPVAVGLVIDNSGSMGPKKADVIAAALSFAQASNPQDQMFVVHFNDRVSLGLPASLQFTDRKEQLMLALSSITAQGQTALYDGVATALDHLNHADRDKKVLILVSDGGDTASKRTLTQVIDMARHSAAIIYTIGIYDEHDADVNPAVLRRFARETGGEAYFPASSSEIAPICERIAHDLRNQYTLAYVPSIAPKDGGFRAITLTASSAGHGRLWARTRSGYFAVRQPPAPATGESVHDIHP